MNEKPIDAPKISHVLDNFIRAVGHTFSWLNVVLILVIILQVVLRYVFGRGLVILEELQWHLYAVGIIFGLSYCLVQDSHIRLDLAHSGFSKRTKEKVEIFGILILLMPLIIIVFLHSVDFLWESIKVNERSDAPMGLPARYIIKSVIPIGFLLFFLAAVSRLIRAFNFLKKGEEN
jgi:TRAP-type mannitol/chloroaromatic compound transport system permease small subunit